MNNAHPDLERELRFFAVENEDPRKLSRQQVRDFNELGFISPLDVFRPDDAAANAD
jgi:hypothetical protein